MLLILAIIAGTNVFGYLGLETPSVWTWTQQNKFYACLMIFFLCNAAESQLISTGAFEILFNGNNKFYAHFMQILKVFHVFKI